MDLYLVFLLWTYTYFGIFISIPKQTRHKKIHSHSSIFYSRLTSFASKLIEPIYNSKLVCILTSDSSTSLPDSPASLSLSDFSLSSSLSDFARRPRFDVVTTCSKK